MKTFRRIDIWEFFELPAGSRFSAVLQDIRPGEMLIRFSCGRTYTAKSLVMPNAHIGDSCLFLVRENDASGRIVLEVAKTEGKGGLKKFDVRV